MILSIKIDCIFMNGSLTSQVHLGIRPILNALSKHGVKIMIECDREQVKEVRKALKLQGIHFDTINQVPYCFIGYSSHQLLIVSKPTIPEYQETLLSYILINSNWSLTKQEAITDLVNSLNDQEPELTQNNF